MDAYKNFVYFFLRIESKLKSQKTLIRNTGTENEIALKASFLISLRIAKSKKHFIIGEDLIMPCMADALHFWVIKLLEKYKQFLNSNDTFSSRKTVMSHDIINNF